MSQSGNIEAVSVLEREVPGGRRIPKAIRPGNLKRKSVRSAAVTLTTQGLGTVLQATSTIVLARLLTPADFGVVAMVVAVTAFARIFQDMGFSTATIQKDDLTHGQVSTLFWLNAASGLLLCLLVMALSPALAWFYNQPEVFWVTIASAGNFLIAGLGVQHAALLKRAMRFTATGSAQLTGSALGFAVSVLAALYGFRYWALVFGTLATTTCTTLMFWCLSRWRPSLPKRRTGVRSLVRFGANITGFEIVNYFSRNMDGLLIGRVWGPELLGLYNRAYSLLLLPIRNLRTPLNAVAFPALSSLQKDPDRYRQYFRKYVALLAFISMPIAAFLFVGSENVIRLTLGEKWVGASDIFSILALSAFMQSVASTRGLVLTSTGQGGRYFLWGLWNALCVGTGFVIGVNWGAIGVAAAYAIVNYLLLYPSLLYCYAESPLRPRDFFESVSKPAIASIVAAGSAMWAKAAISQAPPLMSLLAILAVFALVYFGVFALSPQGTSELREYLSYRSFLKSAKFKNA